MEIALALGGGGVKGVAHVGVIRALEEAGFKICALSGTSAGGMAGAMYLAGYTPDELLKIFADLQNVGLFGHVSGEQPSILGVGGLSKVLHEKIGDLTFEELKVPFAVTASDINSGRPVVIKKGKVADAVLATIAIPGIFPAREWGNSLLVDGGVTNPVPVTVARDLAPNLPVIAVTLNQPTNAANVPTPSIPTIAPQPIFAMVTRWRITQSFQVFIRSMDLSARLLAELRLEQDKPDVIIRPDIHDIGVLDQIDVKDVAMRGSKAAQQMMDEIFKSVRLDKRLLRTFNNYLKRA